MTAYLKCSYIYIFEIVDAWRFNELYFGRRSKNTCDLHVFTLFLLPVIVVVSLYRVINLHFLLTHTHTQTHPLVDVTDRNCSSHNIKKSKFSPKIYFHIF